MGFRGFSVCQRTWRGTLAVLDMEQSVIGVTGATGVVLGAYFGCHKTLFRDCKRGILRFLGMPENMACPFAELDTKQAVTGATAVCFDLISPDSELSGTKIRGKQARRRRACVVLVLYTKAGGLAVMYALCA